MKLRDKDTKKYLLTVFVATFVAYIIPAVVLYLGHFMGIMLTICISLFNLSMALLAWLWAKFVRKEFLLKNCMVLFYGLSHSQSLIKNTYFRQSKGNMN
jgi:small basic protein